MGHYLRQLSRDLSAPEQRDQAESFYPSGESRGCDCEEWSAQEVDRPEQAESQNETSHHDGVVEIRPRQDRRVVHLRPKSLQRFVLQQEFPDLMRDWVKQNAGP